MNIYHITSREAWNQASRDRLYTAPSLAAEGFIHCSTAEQILPVAQKFYRGQQGLVLLVIDPTRLTSPLKWEAPADGLYPAGVRDGSRFPHIHGPINAEAVLHVLDLETDVHGDFTLPAALTGVRTEGQSPQK